jgi:MFS family permease
VRLGLAVGRLDLVGRSPRFRDLFLATLASGLGTGIAVIALVVDVFDRTGSGKWVAALLIVEFLPMLVVGLALGPLVDRLSRRALMIGADLARLAVFALLPFVDAPAAIVALAAVAGLASGLFRPAVFAGLPNLVEERDLPQANGLFQAVENLTWMLGPLAGGALVAAAGTEAAYVVNAVSFAVSALLLARIPARLLQEGERAEPGSHLGELLEGFALVRRSRALRTVLVAWSLALVGTAGVNVAEVSLAKVSFDAGDLGFGLLMAAAGAGLVAGSLSAGTFAVDRPIAAVYGGALALMAVGTGAAAVAPTAWVALPLVAVQGFGNGLAGVCNPLLVQRDVPDALRGRAFTVAISGTTAMLGLGMVVAGPLTDAVGARWVWAGAAAFQLAAAVSGYLLARGLSPPRPALELAVEAHCASVDPRG